MSPTFEAYGRDFKRFWPSLREAGSHGANFLEDRCEVYISEEESRAAVEVILSGSECEWNIVNAGENPEKAFYRLVPELSKAGSQGCEPDFRVLKVYIRDEACRAAVANVLSSVKCEWEIINVEDAPINPQRKSIAGAEQERLTPALKEAGMSEIMGADSGFLKVGILEESHRAAVEAVLADAVCPWEVSVEAPIVAQTD